MLIEKRCATCGKLFYPASQHVFKRVTPKKVLFFHTYSCMTAWDKEHPKAYTVKWG